MLENSMKKLFVISLFLLSAIPSFSQAATQKQSSDEVIVTTSFEPAR